MYPYCHTPRAIMSNQVSSVRINLTVNEQCQPCWCQRLYLSGCMAVGQGFWIITCAWYLSYQLAFLSIATA